MLSLYIKQITNNNNNPSTVITVTSRYQVTKLLPHMIHYTIFLIVLFIAFFFNKKKNLSENIKPILCSNQLYPLQLDKNEKLFIGITTWSKGLLMTCNDIPNAYNIYNKLILQQHQNNNSNDGFIMALHDKRLLSTCKRYEIDNNWFANIRISHGFDAIWDIPCEGEKRLL